MKNKKFRSIIRQVVLRPLIVLLLIMVIMIFACVISYINIEKQMIENNINAMQISYNQLNNQLNEMDNDFIQYITSDESYLFLQTMSMNTPKSKYVSYESDAIKWLEKQAAIYELSNGVYAYYQNLNLLIFREKMYNQKAVHEYISADIKRNNIQYNHWKIVNIGQTQYLYITKKYNNFYWGSWIPTDTLLNDLGLDENKLLGKIYIIDENNNNSLKNNQLNQYMLKKGRTVKKISIKGTEYNNYYVTGKNRDIYFGILIPRFSVVKNIPFYMKLIFLIAIFSLILIPVIIYWLQKKIARPLKKVDKAMNYISEGNMDYRISLAEKNYYDEFDRLISEFNKMMDDINNLQFILYKTKINEQRTELKYISQQIRPHFILNALNIIYTKPASLLKCDNPSG